MQAIIVEDGYEDDEYADGYYVEDGYDEDYYAEDGYGDDSDWEADSLDAFGGIYQFGDRLEAWYSSQVAYHYLTPEWWVDDEGFYRTDEGYYVIAASDYEYGSVIDGSKGECFVADSGCEEGASPTLRCAVSAGIERPRPIPLLTIRTRTFPHPRSASRLYAFTSGSSGSPGQPGPRRHRKPWRHRSGRRCSRGAS